MKKNKPKFKNSSVRVLKRKILRKLREKRRRSRDKKWAKKREGHKKEIEDEIGREKFSEL